MDDTARRLKTLGSATLGESGARTTAPRLKPVWSGAVVAAPAYTARCAPADNLAIHVAVASAPEGSVLVADASHEPERGYWGEVLTTAAEARGIVGLVIDGCVRDIAALEAHAFPVFSAGVALRGAGKVSGGSVGGHVTIAGAEVATGDWIMGDRDGVVVVPSATLDDVLAAAEARAAKEAEMFVQLRAGATTIELLDLDVTPVERH
ncbi:MAG: 4-hydroxy-4-methyl-2-oxoglutarate aldolase [Frankiales bacterium]|jgi:4-hydroxy-4-methyl-2-oxoglutarate aldolase|nr:4-hydroxy-4-methyl-2-oxoglutarate aldolase [Frankiales bacterium]